MWFFILDSGCFNLFLEHIFISGQHGRSWPQQRTKPRPVNIFLQRAEGCPAQAIPGSSISMSFQPYQVLPHSKPSYSEFRRCVQSKHARRVADNEAGKVVVRRGGAQRIRRVKTRFEYFGGVLENSLEEGGHTLKDTSARLSARG